MQHISSVIKKNLPNVGLIILGNLLYSLAVTIFILPCGLITGGTTGLALVVTRYIPISISTFVMISNTIMFFLGLICLGWSFAITTLISSFSYPIILEISQYIPGIDTFTNDPLLATICAGLLIGVGIGLIIRCGASTGGVDIPPLILNKKFGWSVSVCLYVIDVTILLFQAVYHPKEDIILGILLILIYSIVLDQVLISGNARTQVKIVSKKHEAINRMIIHDLDRGSTLLTAETGFYGNETQVILTVISSRELAKLNEMVLSIDPNAFMIINQVNEVKGRGFTLDKVYHTEKSSN